MTTPETPPPEVTDAMREQAREHPGGYVYVVDPAFEGKADIPGWAVRGAYPVDSNGEIREEFVANPNHRPTPQGLNLPRPTNDLERALQFAATGHLPEPQLLAVLVSSEVSVFASESERGKLFVKNLEDGRTALQAFTSESTRPEGWQHWQLVSVRDLAPALRGRVLDLNPGTRVGVQIPGEAIIDFLAQS